MYDRVCSDWFSGWYLVTLIQWRFVSGSPCARRSRHLPILDGRTLEVRCGCQCHQQAASSEERGSRHHGHHGVKSARRVTGRGRTITSKADKLSLVD
ncbi:hypothetical protein KQX54_017784 [Cotesia glomerata]|uniref:Secreted protein n=1 Tax=Cotesia glomerata TaxID=32391 RepID=A0AAV7IGH1_COTGL|nr:hypothetical protein KQX54_017784 [Cotesia glomerata]